MKLTEIYVDGFGTWHNLRLRKLSPEITVFYGPNEAGKTTLMHFLRSMLYGVTEERRERYLPPREGGRPGGHLSILGDDGPFEAARYAERDDEDRGRVLVTLPDGEQQGDRLLREALDAVDEKTFSNVFAIGLDEINELGALEGAEAARWIYRLTSGLDRVSLYDVMQGLRESRTKLLAPAGERSTIVDLLAKRERLITDIGELSVQNRTWSRLMIDMDDSAAQIEQLETELKEAERRARRVEIGLGLKPLWSDRLRIDSDLIRFADLVKVPEGAIESLDRFNSSAEQQQKRIAVLRGQRRQLRDEVRELSVNEVLARSCCRLDALAEQQDWIASLERKSEELTTDTERLASRVESETARLAKLWRHKPSVDAAPELDEETIDLLRPASEEVATAEQLVEEAQREVDSHKTNERQYLAQMESAYTSSEKLGLPTNIEEAGDLVAQLRRRLKSEQKIEQTRRQYEDLERHERHLVDRQVMPIELFVLLSGLFALCGVFAVWPLIAGTAFTVWTAVGLLGGVALLFARYIIEDNAADQLDECQEQIDFANKQIADAIEEQEKLDHELHLEEGSVVLRLQNAERHLEELERMLPVETERRRAKQHTTSAEDFLRTAKADLDKAQAEWRVSLRSVGLPDETTSSEIEKLALQYANLAELRTKAEAKLETLEQCDQEYEKVVRRITALAEEANMVVEDAEPLEQLEHLLSERRLQQGRIEHRKKLRGKSRELKEKGNNLKTAAERIDSERESLFRAALVDGEQAYRQLATDWEAVARLEEKRERLTREIAAAIGQSGTEADYEPLLSADKIGRLDGQWGTLTAEHDTIEKRLRELSVHRTTLEERRQTMVDDTSLADKQIDLDMVEAQLEKAKQQWRVHASVGSMLELIRNDYEEHRQPETLIEASKYLERLTRGRYPRVWTPLADDVLMVDDQDGSSMPVENMSRGAREQLFLSVRMALVAMFARRGVQLPMVLDDVLVNFDDVRAKVAAQVLTDFAKDGHQLFVFTCHEHVWEMFKGLQTDVRRLPVRFEIEEEIEETIEEPLVIEVIPEPEPLPLPEPVVVIEEVIEEVVEEIKPPAFVEAEYTSIEQRVTTKTVTKEIEKLVAAPAVELPAIEVSEAAATQTAVVDSELLVTESADTSIRTVIGPDGSVARAVSATYSNVPIASSIESATAQSVVTQSVVNQPAVIQSAAEAAYGDSANTGSSYGSDVSASYGTGYGSANTGSSVGYGEPTNGSYSTNANNVAPATEVGYSGAPADYPTSAPSQTTPSKAEESAWLEEANQAWKE